jgi:uncharacterized protein (DUF302 family)
MSYAITRKTHGEFDAVIGRVKEALKKEANIGVMLPCNVIIQRCDNGEVEVSSIDPATAMQAVGNPNLSGVANQVRTALERAIEAV